MALCADFLALRLSLCADTPLRYAPEQRRAAMGGALKAAMLIAGVFIAAGAVAILVMQLIWNH